MTSRLMSSRVRRLEVRRRTGGYLLRSQREGADTAHPTRRWAAPSLFPVMPGSKAESVEFRLGHLILSNQLVGVWSDRHA
jgi:hypothetical protein